MNRENGAATASRGVIGACSHVRCMGLLDSIRSRLGSDSETERETYTYECEACNNRFESPVADHEDLECPNCGDHNVTRTRTL